MQIGSMSDIYVYIVSMSRSFSPLRDEEYFKSSSFVDPTDTWPNGEFFAHEIALRYFEKGTA